MTLHERSQTKAPLSWKQRLDLSEIGTFTDIVVWGIRGAGNRSKKGKLNVKFKLFLKKDFSDV